VSGPAIEALFAPLDVGSLRLPNRIVMAPMTRSFSPGGIPGEDVAAYYGRRAMGGVGLIVTEGTVIERPSARNDPGVPFFFGDQALAGWQRVADTVHAKGGRIAPQLWHVGPRPDPHVTSWTAPGPVDSASGIRSFEGPRLAPMSEEAIADTLAAYGRSAANAVRLGFDTIEIHGAHGYLIDDFFWHRTNLRTDRWGGQTLRERARFAAAVVTAVRAEMPANMPLIFRLSQWKGLDFEAHVAMNGREMADWLEPLADAGVDIFHCSQRRFSEPAFPGAEMNLAGWAKKITGRTTITVGSVGLNSEFIFGGTSRPAGIEALLARLAKGEFDLVAVGRALLADADWAEKIRAGRIDDIRGWDPDLRKTLY